MTQSTAIPKPLMTFEELRFAIREGAFKPFYDDETAHLDKAGRAQVNRENRERIRNAREKLRHDLEHVFSLEGHPKRDTLWSIAWEERHSSGFEEVADFYRTLTALVTA